MTSLDRSTERPALRTRIERALAVYLERRVLIILFLGFSSGLPLALSGSTLAVWMTDQGVDLGRIGLYSLVGVPYTIKFLWAPVVDALRAPVLSRLLGRRRGWLVFSQIMLMAAIVLLGSLDPLSAPWLVAAGALTVALASATQDIVVDAFRVESLDNDQQAAGMACYVAAYRVGLLVSTAGAIAVVAWLEDIGVPSGDVWFYGYAAMAVLILIGMAAVLAAREPVVDDDDSDDADAGTVLAADSPIVRLWRVAAGAFVDFMSKPYAVTILLFVLLFKFCDAFAGIMTAPFVIKLGFDKATYAAVVKGVGFAAVLLGGFAGGFLARAMKLTPSLWLAAILQIVSNLAFSWLAWVGVNTQALAVAIVIENFTGGIGTVIFVAYLSSLCTSATHTATQFALLSALAAVGRTVLASSSGFVAEATGWIAFFAITALAGLPALFLLARLHGAGHFASIDKARAEARER